MSRTPMSCQQIYRTDFIERYVRGEGTRGEREAFERHYFECQPCFEKLRACRLIRDELQPAAAGAPVSRWFRIRLRRAWAVGLVASLALVAVALGLWSQRQRAPRPASVPAAAESDGAPVRAPEPAPSIAELARVEPPRYEALRLRGPVDDATRAFRDAMARYVVGDYAAAARKLERAAQLDPQAPDPPFYLGICRLMLDEAPAAVRELQRALRLSDPAAADEARFYLAKAYLRQADVDAARQELLLVAAGGRGHAAAARAILAELDRSGGARP